MVNQLKDQFPINLICSVVSWPRSSFYYREQPNYEETPLRQTIEFVCEEKPRYGYRRVTAQLRRENHRVNHKRVRRLMGEMGLLVRRKRKPERTTLASSRGRKKENLIKGQKIVRPNQVWCSDITYIPLDNGQTIYLALVIDIFTRIIRGWHLSKTMTERLTQKALQKALAIGHTPEIHHSDQGSQYTAGSYCDRLDAIDCRQSWSAAAWENPYAESVVGHIKDELIWLEQYSTFSEAYESISHFLDEVYNNHRVHSSLNYLTPVEFELHYYQAQQEK